MENRFPYLDSIEVFFLPCYCGHERRDHVTRSVENDGSMSSFIGSCRYDTAFFKGMCLCSSYAEMSNLEYLEWQYENKVKSNGD